MANRVPLIVDTTNLHLKELPLGDALDLTGCSIVGLSSFLPGTGGGFTFVGVTTFGMGVGIATVFVNDGLRANYLLASNLTDNQVVTAGAAGSITGSSNLTFDETTFALTGKGTVSNDFRVSGLTSTTNFEAVGVSSIGTLYVHNNRVGLTTTLDLHVTGVTTATGAVKIDNATGSTNKDTGALVVEGGVGVEENLHIGGNVVVQGNIDAKGTLNYTNVTDINSVGVITAASNVQVGAGISVVGISTFKNQVNFVDINHTGIGTFTDVKVGGGLTVTGAADLNGALDVDGQTDLDVLNVAETATFSADVNLIGGGAGITSAFWDQSDASLKFKDNIKAKFGDSTDLTIYHNGSDSYINDEGTGSLKIVTAASGIITIEEADANIAVFTADSGCQLNDGANTARLNTNSHGVFITGITTASSTSHIRIPVGNTSQRPGASVVVDGDIRYNTDLNSYEGYGNNAWGGLGGGTEIDVTVSSTSATNLTTFAKADYRSASLRVQIKQGSNYQVGRYLLIHDDTTATIVEEAAIATNSMLGTISAAINGSNVEVKVTMGSASSATVTTIIDKITV